MHMAQIGSSIGLGGNGGGGGGGGDITGVVAGTGLMGGGLSGTVTLDAAVSVTPIKTANYTASIGELVRCDPTGGGFTVTLPAAAGLTGKSLTIKNSSDAVDDIVIEPAGSDTIDGQPDITIQSARAALTFLSNGTNWEII